MSKNFRNSGNYNSINRTSTINISVEGGSITYLLNKGVIRERICGQDVLLATYSRKRPGSYFILNEDSLFLIDSLEEGKDALQIATAVADQYSVDFEEAKDTVLNFLQILKNYGYIITNEN